MANSNGQKIAWITGAGKGIGRALAVRLANEGWIITASSRTEQDLTRLVTDCAPGQAHAFPLDVSDLRSNEMTVSAIEEKIGDLDLVVLNAGTYIPVTADSFSVESIRQLVETNLMGTVHGLAQIIPRFIQRKGGHIAVVASLAGYRGLPSSAAYGATKAALINMCEALKPELARHGVRLTLINPGFVETPLTDLNDFPMPLIIPVDQAVDYIVRGLRSSAFEVAFPRRFAFMMNLLRLMPDQLFFWLSKMLVRQ